MDIAGTGGFTARIHWSDDYDIATNTSKVSITKIQFKTTWYGVTYYLNGSVSVGGTVVASFSSTKGGHTFKAQSPASTFYDMSVSSGFAAPPYTSGSIAHGTDGSQVSSIAINVSGYTLDGEYGSGWNVSGSSVITLTTIPRASQMTVANGMLGTAQTIKVTRASTGFTHTITYTCGTASGTICTKSSSESISFTPPVSLASQNVSAPSVIIEFKLQTYNGDTAIGDIVSVSAAMAIPDSIAPTVTLALADAKGYLSTYGGYVQNRSQLKVAATCAGSYGSAVVACSIKAGTQTSNQTTATFELPVSGTVTITATVTDTRGRQGTKSATITVLPYAAPSAEITDAYRCDSDGTRNAAGAYAAIVFSATVTALSNKNTAEYTVKHKNRNASTWTSIAQTSIKGNYAPTGIVQVFAANVDLPFLVSIVAKDAFSSVESAYATIQVATVLMDFNRDSKAIGVGARAAEPSAITFGLIGRFTQATFTPAIELTPATGASHGGYIDFHFGGSTADYTSRIIESASGTLLLNGNKILTAANVVAVYGVALTFSSGKCVYSNSAITATSVVIVQRRSGTAGSATTGMFATSGGTTGQVTIVTDNTAATTMNVNILIINTR